MTWLLAIPLAPFCVVTAFVFCFTVQRLLDTAPWCPWWIKGIAVVWYPIGFVADAVFNWTWGSVIFRERPRFMVFTNRIQHHVDHSSGWRHEKALQWASMLNAIDPGHIKGVPE